jgi:hypothetical protein
MARKRKPMPTLAAKLAAVSDAAVRLQSVEEEAENARAELWEALREAHHQGATYSLLAELSGYSRQRVSQILGG